VLNGPIIHDRLGLQLRGSYLDRQRSERIVASSTSRDPRPSKAENYDVGGKLQFTFDDKNSFWVDGFTSNQTYDNSDQRLGNFFSRGGIAGYEDELEFNRLQISAGHDGNYDFGQWKTYISQNKTETKGRTIPTDAFLL
jgi:outer membrane receptor for ferrienterochelin and colicins